ncbi:hypothetical protein Q3G72_034163 [Acer saccharum]|nr:hypothetical protein Q3G72_034163 [Acer saccharum]
MFDIHVTTFLDGLYQDLLGPHPGEAGPSTVISVFKRLDPSGVQPRPDVQEPVIWSLREGLCVLVDEEVVVVELMGVAERSEKKGDGFLGRRDGC